MHIKSINKQNIWTSLKFVVIMPWALVARLWEKDVWIITERSNQARDNGYCFYQYVREKHPEQKIIYIIDKSAPDYNKICKYKTIIQFDSLAHYYYYCLSKIHISAHVGGCIPSYSPIAKRLKRFLKIKDVFLPHGVSYGISEFCLRKYANIDLFICSGKPEYENILNNYGYNDKEVAYTGFPRLDKWYNIKINTRQILLMPTWRSYIALCPEMDIRNTIYFKTYQELLNNKELEDFLYDNNLHLVFCLHNDMQQYVRAFSTTCSNIIIKQPNQYDIQEVLKESALLITDYSSVHFDFAYMNKPVIYFPFDTEVFFEKQYKKSFFDPEKNGFGEVVYTIGQLINAIKQSYNLGFSLKGRYLENMQNFYTIKDGNNNSRVFMEIKKRLY